MATQAEREAFARVMVTVSDEGRAAIFAHIAEAWEEGWQARNDECHDELVPDNPYRKD